MMFRSAILLVSMLWAFSPSYCQLSLDGSCVRLGSNNRPLATGNLFLYADSTYYITGDSTDSGILGWHNQPLKGRWQYDNNNKHITFIIDHREPRMFQWYWVKHLTKNKLVLRSPWKTEMVYSRLISDSDYCALPNPRIEVVAKFRGGKEAFRQECKTIFDSLRLSAPATLGLLINKSGQVESVNIINGLGKVRKSVMQELIKAIQNMHSWTPAVHDGKNIPSYIEVEVLDKL